MCEYLLQFFGIIDEVCGPITPPSGKYSDQKKKDKIFTTKTLPNSVIISY